MSDQVRRICVLETHDLAANKIVIKALVVQTGLGTSEVFRTYQVRGNTLALLDVALRPDELDECFETTRLDLLCETGRLDDGNLTFVAKLLEMPAGAVQDLAFTRRPWPTPRKLDPRKFVKIAQDPVYVVVTRTYGGTRALLHVPSDGRRRLYGLPSSDGLRLAQVKARVETALGRLRNTPPFLAAVILDSEHGELLMTDLLMYDQVDVRARPWSERQTLVRQLMAEIHLESQRAENWAGLDDHRIGRNKRLVAHMQLQSIAGDYSVAPIITE